MPECAKCKDTKPRADFYRNQKKQNGLNSYCKECAKTCRRISGRGKKRDRRKYEEQYKADGRRAATMRKYYLANKEKFAARRKTLAAINKGLLTPEACRVCGTLKDIEAHHPDYAKPLHVMWLCRTHHYQLHVEERDNARVQQ